MKSWRAQSEDIPGATTMSALTRYERLSRDMGYIEEVLDSTASSLSAHIDIQIDATFEDLCDPAGG